METGARIDLKTAAGRSGQTVQHLRWKIKTGELPAVKDGRKLYVSPEDLESHMRPERSLEEFARDNVGEWPRFSDERRKELGRLLGDGTYDQEAVRKWTKGQAEDATSMSTEQSHDEPEPLARPKFSAETDAAIDRIVASAPALSEGQKQRLREILGGEQV